MLLPFGLDVKVQQVQRGQMAVMGFLAGLHFEYNTAKYQILASHEISSLQETFTNILYIENSPLAHQPVKLNSALVSWNNDE